MDSAVNDRIGKRPLRLRHTTPDHPLRDAYAVLAGLAPLIAEHAGKNEIFTAVKGKDERMNGELAGYRVEVAFKSPTNAPAYALIISTGRDEFVVAGSSLEAGFNARTPGARHTRILSIDEGEFKAGRWIAGRRMNGDENSGGWRLKLPSGAPTVQRIKLYRHD